MKSGSPGERRRYSRLLGFAASIVLLLAVLVLRDSQSEAKTPAAERSPVVVELFTSEGCSSCPPADALLRQLRQEHDPNGAEVIPLGFHVDYWDFQGWRDRFDSAAYSQRQEHYAHQLRIDGPYTPQMIVNGEVEFVGSDASRARQAIAQAAAQEPLAQLQISAAKGALDIKAHSAAPADVMLAITEDNLTTKVGRGENGGRTLHHSAVVRELRRIGQATRTGFSGTVPITVEKEWKRDDLRAVVFVQDGSSGKILGAASVPLKSLPGAN